MIASIPSPSFDSIDLGPLQINIYGLAIALGVIAAIWLFGRRLEQRGAGSRDDASAIGLWAVLAGVVGARLYHVITDWHRFEDDLGAIPAIWEGGLGIPGGLILGIPAGIWAARRRGISAAMAATCAAPAIPLAQAIGRWGNYFNQELYGRPTDLPWALEVDPEHLEPGYAIGTTFHPTFLYESLWCLGLCLLLLWIDRRFRPALGQLMAMYVIGYGIGRFWIEGLRIDTADEVAGLRWNQWMALAAVVGGAIVLAYMRRHPVVADGVAGGAAGEPAAEEDRTGEVSSPDDVTTDVDDVDVSSGDLDEDEMSVDEDEMSVDEDVSAVDEDVSDEHAWSSDDDLRTGEAVEDEPVSDGPDSGQQ